MRQAAASRAWAAQSGRVEGGLQGPGQFEIGHGNGGQPVEPVEVLDHGGVAPDLTSARMAATVLDALILAAFRRPAGCRGGPEGGVGRDEALDGNHVTSPPPGKGVDDGLQGSRLTLREAWIDHQAAGNGHDVPTATRLLAFRVPPVDTRSTMASANPARGRQFHRTGRV